MDGIDVCKGAYGRSELWKFVNDELFIMQVMFNFQLDLNLVYLRGFAFAFELMILNKMHNHYYLRGLDYKKVRSIKCTFLCHIRNIVKFSTKQSLIDYIVGMGYVSHTKPISPTCYSLILPNLGIFYKLYY